jgi:hypothetical protein
MLWLKKETRILATLDSGRRKVKFATGGAAYVKLDTLRKI